MGNYCDCFEYYDEEYVSMIMENAAESAKQRKAALKKGEHWKDEASSCNLTEFREVSQAITNSRAECKKYNLSPIINIIAEYVVGQKSDFDDRCQFCFKSKGIDFFPDHPNSNTNLLSCHACKCNHISMVTRVQAKKKYTKLQVFDQVFDELCYAGKSVDIRRNKRYRIRDEYFLITDIEEKCIQLFGSIKGAKKDRKKRVTKKKDPKSPKQNKVSRKRKRKEIKSEEEEEDEDGIADNENETIPVPPLKRRKICKKEVE